MPTIVRHPRGRFLSREEPGPFDVCFSASEMALLSGDFCEDVYPHVKTEHEIGRREEDLQIGAFITTTTAWDEKFSDSQRFHFARYRLRSLLELNEE